MKQVAITTVSWYHLYEGSDIKITTFSNLHERACAFGERLMLGLESFCNFSTEKMTDLVEEIPFFPTTARRTASAGESNDGNDVPINALNLVAMKILRPRPTLTSI